ncbi:TPA: hypothetical protein ACGWER_001752 [Streptococcus agalactiae]|nr:hypothetical protein [Streptococcus agalactiae]HEO7770326.1 hypothetical protein [Streptococcus agalactiae]
MANETLEEKENQIEYSTTYTMVDIRQKRHEKDIYFKQLDFITQGRSIKALNAVLPMAYLIGYIAVGFIIKMIFIKSIGSFILFLIPSLAFVLLLSFVTIMPKYDKTYLTYTIRYIQGLKTKFHKQKVGIVYEGNRAIFPNGDQLEIWCGQGRINQTSFQRDILSERDSLSDARNDLVGATHYKVKSYGDQRFTDQKKNLKDIIQNGTPIQKEKAKKMSLDFRKRMTMEKVEKQYLLFRTTNEEERLSVQNYYRRIVREKIFIPEVDFDDNKAQEMLKKFILT